METTTHILVVNCKEDQSIEFRIFNDLHQEMGLYPDMSIQDILEICENDRLIQVVIMSGLMVNQPLQSQLKELPQDVELINLSKQPVPFTQLSALIENIGELGIEKRANRQISKFSSRLHDFVSREEVMKLTCEMVVGLFGVDRSGFVEFDENSKHGWKVSEFPEVINNKELIPVFGIPAEEQVVLQGECFVSNDIRSDNRLGPIADHLKRKGILSILIVPVKAGKRVIGSFSLDSTTGLRVFKQGEVDLCLFIANLVGTVLQNIHRKQVTTELRASLNALHSVTSQGALGNLSDTLQAIVEQVCRHMNVDVSTLYTYDENNDRFVSDVGFGELNNSRSNPRDLTEISSPFRMLNLVGEKFAYTEDSPNDPRFRGGFVMSEHIQSTFGMPLQYDDEPVGVFFLNYRDVHHFRDEELSTFEQFGRQAAVIIKIARLKDQSEKQLKALEGLYSTDNYNYNMNPFELEGALKRIAEQALIVVGADGRHQELISHIAILKGNLLEFVAASSGEVLEGLKEKIGQINIDGADEIIGLVGKTIRENRTLNIPNVHDDPSYLEYRKGIHSQISVRLFLGERIFGVLSVESSEENAFNSGAEKNLEHLAKHAEMAIQNSRLAVFVNDLFKTVDFLASNDGVRESLNSIAKLVRELFDCEIVNIFTYFSDSDEVSYPAIFAGRLLVPERPSNPDLENPTGRLRIDQFPDGSVFHTLKNTLSPIYCSADAQEHPIVSKGSFVHREHVKAVAALPLIIDGKRLVGFLFLNYRKEHTFSETELMEINIFGKSVAHVIDYYRFYDELLVEKGRVGNLVAQVWMKSFADRRENEIKKQVRIILANLALISQRLRIEDPLLKESVFMEKINNSQDASKEILRQLETPFFQKSEDIEIGSIISEYLQNDHRINVITERIDEAKIIADPNMIRHGINQIITFMLESAEKIDRPRLVLFIQAKNEQVIIKIADFGSRQHTGAPDELNLRLNQSEEKYPLNLMVAKAIFMFYEGRMECQPNSPSGTIFTIYFPIHERK